MLGLHKDNAHALDSSDAQPVEIPGTTPEYGSRFPGPGTRERTSSWDSSQDTDVGVADVLANIKATSFGYACFLVEFLGEVRWYHSASTPTAWGYAVVVISPIRSDDGAHESSAYEPRLSTIYRVHLKLKLSKGGCYALVIRILTGTTDEMMKRKKIGIFYEDFLPASR
ncbi:uncharacterized protein ARMOST_22073 [Armillaria ostoyae]|uniref:Uncharacterized protein n=1 Tax=Armillaria ostoyae TaxID=47428 RepID=A0A284SBW7_ARMOS|nr:uncharacterized protein ARMOST_22073 [Armillaria ostoyae]